MRTLVMPAFERLLREITVRRVDTFLKTTCRNGSYSRAKHARAVLSLALAMAVRYDAIPKNPVADAAPLHKPKSQPTSLTLDGVQLVRDAIRTWEHATPRSGPSPDGQLGAIVEIMPGTSARIREVLALRRCDVNVTKAPATVRITGTIVTVNEAALGRGVFQQAGRSATSAAAGEAPAATERGGAQACSRVG
jgi:integrase